MLLNGFDYATYLKKQLMVGQVDPWRRTDEGKPLLALLVTVEYAMNECKEWSGQDILRSEFLKHLNDHHILVLRDVNEFKNIKEEIRKPVETTPLSPKKRKISDKTRERLLKQLETIKHKTQKGSISENPA